MSSHTIGDSLWTVVVIPTFPVSDNHLELYKGIRLAGLLFDPQAFGSTFAKESTYTQEMWRSRINNKGRITLLAIDREEKEAIGTLSIILPEVLSSIPKDPEYPPQIAESEKEGRLEVYMMVGMWVHSDHRAKGVGRALVSKALESIDIKPSKLSFQDANPDGIALLLVHNDQEAAMRLYQASGFIIQGEVEHAGKPSTWMAAY